jgi:hypothetical protein
MSKAGWIMNVKFITDKNAAGETAFSITCSPAGAEKIKMLKTLFSELGYDSVYWSGELEFLVLACGAPLNVDKRQVPANRSGG